MFQIFTGFIAFVCALDLNMLFSTERPYWNPTWPTPDVQINKLTRFLDPPKCGGRHWNHIFICLSLEVIGKNMSNMAAILKFKMAATRGRFGRGS